VSRITVSTYPPATALTTLRRVKVELGLDLAGSTHDELLDDLIGEASAAIEAYCGRDFARATVTEVLPGTGRTLLQLTRTPVVSVSGVVYSSASTIASSEYYVEDQEQGTLYRDSGWYWTVGETAEDLVPRYVPSQPMNDYSVTYVGGYLVPAQNLSAATLEISTSTACVKDSGSGFPTVVAGDRITTAGWTTAANNRTLTVVSGTAAKIVVDSTALTAEASTDRPRTVVLSNLPRDLERACVETVKAWYLGRQHDPAVTTKTVGPLSLSYSVTALQRDLPAAVSRIIAPYRRYA